MFLEKVVESLKGVVCTSKKPEPLQINFSKSEKKDYEKRLKVYQKEKDRQKRRLLVFGGTAAAVAIGTFVFLQALSPVRPSVPAGDPRDFSGDVGQTAELIHRWNAEVNGDARLFSDYAPRVANLSTAYFSRQMTEMYPDKSAQYDLDKLRGRFRFMTAQEYDKKNTCDEGGRDYVPASEDPLTSRIDQVPERLIKGATYKNETMLSLFLVNLHELLHSTAIVRRDNVSDYVASQTAQLRRTDVKFIKGLRLFVPQANQLRRDPNCYSSWWIEEEETVVEDAATKLSQRVGIQNKESNYLPWLADYNQKVLNPYFGGDFRELLRLQQDSDPDGFLDALGVRMVGTKMTRNNRIGTATQLIVPLLDRRRLSR